MSIHDSRDSIGRAGLMSLMGDPRYTDANHPEHDMVVDMIRRGFEMVMGEVDAPGFATLFDNDDANGRRIEEMNSDARAAFGRGLILQAIRAEGSTMPSGFDKEGVAAPGFRTPLGAPRTAGSPARSGPAERETAQGAGDPKVRTMPPAPRPPLKPPVPQPGTQATPGQQALPADPIPPVPANKREIFQKKPHEWPRWHLSLDGLKDDSGQKSLSKTERFIYGQIFAAEGGAVKDPASSAFGGVTDGALTDAQIRESSLSRVTRSEDLTLEQLAVAYRGYFKEVLESYGGRAELNKLADQKTAATFSDTLFVHGRGLGPKLVKKGINKLMDTLTAEDKRRIGLRPLPDASPRTDTIYNLQRLDAVGLGPSVRDAITNERLDVTDKTEKGKRARIEHFRFSVKSAP